MLPTISKPTGPLLSAPARMPDSNTSITRWSVFPLRLIVGYGFMAHGFAKWARGADAFATVLHGLGVPAPLFAAWTTIGIEFLGGFLILIGTLVKLSSLPLAAVLIVAAVNVHLRFGFSSVKLLAVKNGAPQFGPPGYELNLFYLACLLALVLGGPGPWALDDLLKKRRSATDSASFPS